MTELLDRADLATAMPRRQRLREGIAKFATAIANGERTVTRPERDAIVDLCRDYFLPVEAACVMRWTTS